MLLPPPWQQWCPAWGTQWGWTRTTDNHQCHIIAVPTTTILNWRVAIFTHLGIGFVKMLCFCTITTMTAMACRNTMMMDDHQHHHCHITATATTILKGCHFNSRFIKMLYLQYVLWYYFWSAYHHQSSLDFSIVVKNTFLLYWKKQSS